MLFKTSLSSSSHSPESPVFLTTCTTWGQSRWGPHHVDDVRMVCETQSWPHLFLLDLSPLPASSGHGSVSPTNRRGHGSSGYKQAEALQVNSASLESLQHPDSICFRSLLWGHLRMRCALWPNFAKFPGCRCILNPLHPLSLSSHGPTGPLSSPHTTRYYSFFRAWLRPAFLFASYPDFLQVYTID